MFGMELYTADGSIVLSYLILCAACWIVSDYCWYKTYLSLVANSQYRRYFKSEKLKQERSECTLLDDAVESTRVEGVAVGECTVKDGPGVMIRCAQRVAIHVIQPHLLRYESAATQSTVPRD